MFTNVNQLNCKKRAEHRLLYRQFNRHCIQIVAAQYISVRIRSMLSAMQQNERVSIGVRWSNAREIEREHCMSCVCVSVSICVCTCACLTFSSCTHTHESEKLNHANNIYSVKYGVSKTRFFSSN